MDPEDDVSRDKIEEFLIFQEEMKKFDENCDRKRFRWNFELL